MVDAMEFVGSANQVNPNGIAALLILPRQGEVAPKVTEGEDTKQRLPFPPPPTGKRPPLAWEDQ
jgi:hypothetical protein